jgi:hypothetical protein
MQSNNQFKEREEKNNIRKTIFGITKIQPLIHRVKFSSPEFGYSEIVENLVKLKVQEGRDKKMPNYNNFAYGQLRDGTITVYFNPLSAFFPPIFIIPSSTNIGLLNELYQAIPELDLSYIEYTIDLYCKNSNAVIDLFYALRKNIYFPWGNKTRTSGGAFYGIDNERTINAIFQVNVQSSTRYLKIYERGHDKDKEYTPKKKIGRWKHKNCDRVRIEYVYKRPKTKQKGPSTLLALLKNPIFLQIIGKHNEGRSIDEIRFKKFKNRAGLPQYWEEYPAQDDRGHHDCFIQEYKEARKRMRNANQHIEDHDCFNALKSKIDSAIIKFNKKWEKEFKNGNKKNAIL